MRLRWRIAWLASYPLARFLFRFRVTGRERLLSGPQILASNHVSNADPLVVGWAAARELHFLAKEELFRASRLFEWLIRSWNAWPVRRGIADATAVRHCVEVLERGNTLVLFPEGKRSKSGAMAEFKPGVGMLALAAGVPVVPTLIHGLDRSWLSYLVDRDFVARRERTRPKGCPEIEVRFGEPVHPGEFGRSRAGYEAFTRVVENRVRGLARCGV